MRQRIAFVLLATVTHTMAAQWPPSPNANGIRNTDSLVAVVRAATARYADQPTARRDGYRPIGPDAPGMGQHWVNPRLAMSPTVDPHRPAILSYVTVAGAPRLAGVAMLTMIPAGDSSPSWPDAAQWHAHSGDLEDEGLGLAEHVESADVMRAAMLHVWAWQENPDGVLATDNWSLPFIRAGLTPPAHAEPEAARAVSLLTSGVPFFTTVLERSVTLTDDMRATVAEALKAARADVTAQITLVGDAARGDMVPDATLRALALRWREVVATLQAALPPGATRAMVDRHEH